MATQYEFYNGSADAATSISGGAWRGQSFTVGTVSSNVPHIISSIKVMASITAGLGSTNLIFDIYATDGGGLPTGSALSTGTTDSTGWSTSAEWHEVVVSAYTLEPSTKYAIVIHSADTNAMRWWADNTSTSYSGGSYLASGDFGATWSATGSIDFLFEIWGNSTGLYSGLINFTTT